MSTTATTTVGLWLRLDESRGSGQCPRPSSPTGYDANSLRQHLAKIGAEAVIPSTRSRKAPIPHDPVIYKLRNRIERCFNKLKHFRRFATRYDRIPSHYTAFIHLAATMTWMR